jgi:hypothetical protein
MTFNVKNATDGTMGGYSKAFDSSLHKKRRETKALPILKGSQVS